MSEASDAVVTEEAAETALDGTEQAGAALSPSELPNGQEEAASEASGDDVSKRFAAIAAWMEVVASIREEIRRADAHVEERTLDLKHAKKRRDSLQEQLNSLVDEGWQATRLPLDGDIRQPVVIQSPSPSGDASPLSMQTTIDAAGFDTDLRVTIETIQQDYQIQTLGDLDKWLATFPPPLRAAYLNAGQESAIVAKIAEAKGRLQDADESWRETSIDELNLPGKLPEYLREAGIETVGHLADYTGSGKWLTDIPHVGKAKAEEIENAMDAFWAKRSVWAHSIVEQSELPVPAPAE